MKSKASHERLKLRSVFLVPVGVAMATGLWLGFQHQSGQAKRQDERRLQELRDQAKFLTEGVWAALNQVRAQTLLSLEKKQILHDSILEIGRATRLPNGSLKWLATYPRADVAPALELRGSLATAFGDDTARRLGVAAVSLPPDLVLAFPLGTELAIARIDPVKEFGVFDWIHANVDPSRKRAFLLDARGAVLVHSERAFTAGDFSRTEIFKKGVKAVVTNLTSANSSKTRAGTFRAIDQQSVHAAIFRISDLPLAVVVEEVVETDRLAARANAVRVFGQGLFALGVVALLVFLSTLITREKLITFMTRHRASPAEPPESAPDFSPLQIPMISPVTPIRNAARAAHASLPKQPPVEALLEQFERLVPKVRDTQSLMALVTDTVARISKTQVLYFKFDENLRHLFLQFDAGFERTRAPAAMACPFSDQAIRDALEISRSGELISVTDYAPLRKLMSERLGVTFYEAWGVTSSIQIPQHAPRMKIPRILGVLVILHPNFEVATRRESLFRILRATAQTHELQP